MTLARRLAITALSVACLFGTTTTPARAELPVEALLVEASDALARHRTASGLPFAVAEEDGGAYAHARYLATNHGRPEVAGLRVHQEDATLPGATDAGGTAAARSHVASGAPTATGAIDGLIDAPLHRHALMDPRLERIGLGHAGEGTVADPHWWVVDLAARDRPWLGPPVAIAYPGPGQMQVPLRFADGETPDPRSVVAGTASAIAGMGYPVTLSFFGCRPTATDARLSLVGDALGDGTVIATGDADVPLHVLIPGTTIRTETGDRNVEPVLFFARDVLRPQAAYRATVVATCGALGTNTYEWTFATRARLRAADVTVAVGAPGPDGAQEVTLVAGAGGIAVPARVTQVEASFTMQGARTGSAPATGGAPEIALSQPAADANGQMRLRINLRGAPTADVTATVVDEASPVKVSFVVRPAASGETKVVVPATAPFPRLQEGRASWVPMPDTPPPGR